MQGTSAALLLLSTLAISGCSNPAPGSAATSAEGLHGTRWLLSSWEGQPESEIWRRVNLEFSDDGISGEGPCNVYNAGFTLQSGAFRVGPIASTKRGCDPPRMQLERAWFGALGKLDKLALDGAGMVLSGEDGTRLEFVRADESPTKP